MGIITDVQQVGAPTRSISTLERRVLKAGEEQGELCEALLSVTSKSNGKNKRYMDVIEEAVDVAIMGLDIALTKPPNTEETITDDMWRSVVKKIISLKLKKWQQLVDTTGTLIHSGEIDFNVNELYPYVDRKPVLLSEMMPPTAEDAITREQAEAIAVENTWLAHCKRVRGGYVDPMTDREFTNQLEMEEDAGLHE